MLDLALLATWKTLKQHNKDTGELKQLQFIL